MAEYIVEFDKTPYDQMVAKGIIKETDNQTLYGMPVNGEIIRCRDCDGSKRKGLERCPTFEAHGKNPDGFCAWAERDA